MRSVAAGRFPGTAEHFPVGERDLAHEVEHEARCVLCDIEGAVARAVGGDDAVARQCGYVNVVDADGHARDDTDARLRHGVCRCARYGAELTDKTFASGHLRGVGVGEWLVGAPDEFDLLVHAPLLQDLSGLFRRAVYHVVQDAMCHGPLSSVYLPLIMRRRAGLCTKAGMT